MVKRVILAIGLALVGTSWALAGNDTVPAGTTVHCRLSQTITTKLNFEGDPFKARVSEPVVIDGHDAIPIGSTVEGRIARLEKAGVLQGASEMRLLAEKITFPDGRSYPLNAVLMSAFGAEGARVVGQEGSVKGPGSRPSGIGEIGGGFAAGGIIGGLIHGFSGTLVGGAMGATAGFVDRLRRHRRDLTLPTGTELKYQLTRPLRFQR